MNVKLEKYLNAVDKHLRPLPVSERSDIVREIRGSVIEMENEGVSEDQILERLGNPKEMAKAYLGSLLEKKESSGWNKILIICAFYSMVGLTGMIIIPVLAVIAPVFIVCGVTTPFIAFIKMIDYIFSLGLPVVGNIRIFLGGITELNAVAEFICSLKSYDRTAPFSGRKGMLTICKTSGNV